ncbi:MAG TPA: type II secretion system F family protein [Ktedonobacterales bacterium]|nr:type II secretion system F family protein [Ktedonobacterales bacterium]
MAILLGLMIGGGIALLFVGLQRVLDTQTNTIGHRLDNFVIPVPGAMPDTKSRRGRRDRRRRAAPVYVRADDASTSRSSSARWSRDLARADLKITVGEFKVLRVVLASVGGLIGFAIPVGGHFLLGVVFLAFGYFGPAFYVTSHKNKRQGMFNQQLADVITLMSGSLRSGYSLLQAMELVAREAPQPVATEFDRVVREVGLGLSPEEALSNLVERMQSEDLELLVTAINVQREVGGNLVEVLDTISATIRDRVKLVGEVKVLTAQQQYSGYIIAMLPVALALLLGVINPSYMLGVFTETTWCGWTMAGCSFIMIFAGFLLIRQIVNIKV